MADKEQGNPKKRAAPEKEEQQDEEKAPTPTTGEKESNKTTTEPDPQRRRVEASSPSSSSSYDYDLHWDQFAEFGSGNDVTLLTGAQDALGLCDEKVAVPLVAVGRRLLDALAPPTADDDAKPETKEGGEDEEDQEEEGDENKESKINLAPELLSPLQVVVGQWHEDVEAGKQRTKIVEACAEETCNGASLTARVYRADGTAWKAGQEAKPQVDRFELTFLDWGEERQYIFVVDKEERRFVFVGEDGSHPHCGTNEFVYDNSDGSGPGLFGVYPAPPPTPAILLAAARKRFVEYCRDRYH